MSRYRAEGFHVYQGDTIIATCNTGDQGQLASAIAERIAALLNADFERFCQSIVAGVPGTYSTRTHGRLNTTADLPLEGC